MSIHRYIDSLRHENEVRRDISESQSRSNIELLNMLRTACNERDIYKKALEEIAYISFRMVGNMWEEDSSRIEKIAKEALKDG